MAESQTDPQTDEPRTHEFKAEIKQLLDILIHSIYTSKDVFVRELISNAADALEKIRFQQAAGQAIRDPDLPLEIRIEADSEGRRLIISDAGIGMTEEELDANIGTIAHSGATAFLQHLQQENSTDDPSDISLIGRFGVGFYSVFMVADKVTISTQSAEVDAKPVVWTSDGAGQYTTETPSDDVPRGTRIEIDLKQDESKFADPGEIKSVIQRYSNFVPFPIFVNDERVNQTTALWREPPSQISDDQYNEFYKLISHDFQPPILRLHHSVDGALQFSALLFVPQNNPEVMGFGEGDVNLELYVQRVLIDGKNQDCLPRYLRMVRGVVESSDLPLNVSRETLQQNRILAKIRDILTGKILDLFLELAENDADKYKSFWKTYQRVLKEGYNDFAHREKIQELYRFSSSVQEKDDDLVGLARYVSNMPEHQSAIYFLSGASREALDRDPRLELFRKNNIEVLYLYDAADEFVLGSLGKYKDKDLVSADHAKPEDLKIGDTVDSESQDGSAADEKDVQPLIDRFQEILGDRVVSVRASERLIDSPACLIGDDNQMSSHMEKVMRMMNPSDELPKRILEINPKHPLIQHLEGLLSANPTSPFVDTACEHLFEGCLLMDGYLTDPHKLVERMNQVLTTAAGQQLESDG